MTSLLEYKPESALVGPEKEEVGGVVVTKPKKTLESSDSLESSVILGPTSVYVRAFSEPPASGLRCLLPGNLDLHRLCDERAEGARWPAKHRHKLAYVVHAIVSGFHRLHAETEDEEARGVPLSSALLQSLLVKNRARDFATDAVKTLTAWGVIERAGNHRAGFYCRHHRLAAAYRDTPAAWATFDAPKLVKRLRDWQTRETARAASVAPAFGFIRQSLATVALAESGHVEAAQQVATFTNPRTREAWLLSVHDLAEPAARFSHSKKAGRIYHTVSNCPAELRRHLTVDGEEAAEVDISASQFCLLLGLYQRDCDERHRFAAIVTSGQFYEHLFKLVTEHNAVRSWGDGTASPAELWQRPGEENQRCAFKKHAIRKVLYERLYPGTVSAGLWPAFAAEFPALAGELAMRRQSQPAASAFCCVMQQREAKLILGRVVPRIRTELAGCLPVTLHDGILCQLRFADDVKRIVEEEALAMFGARPAVRVKCASAAPQSAPARAA